MEYGFPSAYGQTAKSRSLPTDSDTHPQISRTAVSAILAIGPSAAPQTHRQTHEYRCPSTPLQVMAVATQGPFHSRATPCCPLIAGDTPDLGGRPSAPSGGLTEDRQTNR